MIDLKPQDNAQAIGTKSVIDKFVVNKRVLNEKPVIEFIERMRARGFNVETDGVDVFIMGDNIEAYINEFKTLAELVSAKLLREKYYG